MVWLPMVKNLKISLFILTEFTNVTDTQTHTQTPHDHMGRAALAQHRAAKMNSAYEHGIYVRLHVRVCVLVSVR